MLKRVVAALLRVPLFYKILGANAAVVVLGAIAGTLVTVRLARTTSPDTTAELIVVFAVLGLVLSVVLNALILRLALTPVRDLERTVARIGEGDDAIRAPTSPLADAEIEQLITTFNAMLDRLDRYRGSLREMAQRAVGAQEEERRRIAQELHDDTAQRLANLQIRLAVARRQADPAERERRLEEVRDGLEEAARGVRRFARGLRPPALDELGLRAALEAHGRRVEEDLGIAVEVEGPDIRGALDGTAELAAYRIAQEAIANAARHAAPTRIHVSIARDMDAVQVTVQDDGRGFTPDAIEARPGHGLGLFGMRERAVYVGGEVVIRSEPGAGTTVALRLPAAGRGPDA